MKSPIAIALIFPVVALFAASKIAPASSEPIAIRKESLAADDKQLSPVEIKAIQATKSHLEASRKSKTPLDARYRVFKTSTGYEVFVQFVGGYTAQKKPVFYLGGHCTSQLNQDFIVTRILPGA